VVHLCLIAVGLIQGPQLVASLDTHEIREPSWKFAIEMIAIVAAGVVFVVGFQAARRAPAADWPRPSWFENPFGRDRWVPLFEATSYYMLAAGMSSAVLELRGTPRTWAWEIPAAIAAGLLLGARVCLLVFRQHFRQPTQG
jgi:hypothetical protein